MLRKESAHNFLRFVLCRDVNLETLEGLIYDYACGLHPYSLNREPEDFEFIRFLVDGSHWNGQKKLKKPDKSGKGGHLGCSRSYNFNEYKSAIENQAGHKINSQGREELHSLIIKCASSLQQKNYQNFFSWMITFFAINNLQNMDLM